MASPSPPLLSHLHSRLLAASLYNRQYREVERALGTRAALDMFPRGMIALTDHERAEVDRVVAKVSAEDGPSFEPLDASDLAPKLKLRLSQAERLLLRALSRLPREADEEGDLTASIIAYFNEGDA